MIVLDEQLLGYGLKDQIAKWYRGTVTDITQLRPGTVIEDETIPSLLRTVRQPTFVTINVSDFWRHMEPDPQFCITCFALPHSRAEEIPNLLRRLFTLAPFRTRKRRLSKIARVARKQVQFYAVESRVVQLIEW